MFDKEDFKALSGLLWTLSHDKADFPEPVIAARFAQAVKSNDVGGFLRLGLVDMTDDERKRLLSLVPPEPSYEDNCLYDDSCLLHDVPNVDENGVLCVWTYEEAYDTTECYSRACRKKCEEIRSTAGKLLGMYAEYLEMASCVDLSVWRREWEREVNEKDEALRAVMFMSDKNIS